MGWNRARDDRTRTYHRPKADFEAWEDRRIGADRCSGSDDGLLVGFEPLPAARKAIVCKGRIRSYEHVILEHDPIPELDSALDGHSIADYYLTLDKNAVADIAVLADTCSLEHMGEGPDARASTDCVALA